MSVPEPKCLRCKRPTKEPRYFPCGHMTCHQCVTECYNESMKKTKIKTEFPCPTCKKSVAVPAGGVRNFPRTRPSEAPPLPPKWSTQAPQYSEEPATRPYEAEAVLTTSESQPLFLDLASGGELKFQGYKFLWNYTAHKFIWDVAFLEDGSVVYITTKQTGGVISKELHRLSIQGDPLEMEPPAYFNDPLGISSEPSKKSLAVSDWHHNTDHTELSIYTNVGGEWDTINHSMLSRIERLTLTQSGMIYCCESGCTKLHKLGKKGQVLWTKSLPLGNISPYIASDPDGRVIVSTPNSYKVTIYNSNGELHQTMPTQFLKEPTGVCTDSAGRILIADKASKSIRLFRNNGNHIKQMMHTDADPRSISLHDDRFLAIATPASGLYMYELLWQ